MSRIEPIVHWPLDRDVRDAGPGECHGLARQVRFEEVAGRSAAVFDGVDAQIDVADHPALRLGDQPFTLAAWVHVSRPVLGAYGDVISRFDPRKRRGLNLRIGGSKAGYCGLSDQRLVQAGIDDGTTPAWTDHGKPWPSNPLISTLTVHDGSLYVGTADADLSADTPAVYRYSGGGSGGGTTWEHCGRLPVDDKRTRSVMAMAVHNGALYAATGTWDWRRAIARYTGPTHVYRYDGGTRWTDCGKVGDGGRIQTITSFNGSLFAGTDTGHVFRYAGEGQAWEACGQAGDHQRTNALYPFQGRLYVAPHGAVFRYDGGTQWSWVGGQTRFAMPADTAADIETLRANFFGENQCHCLQTYDHRLWVGCWPSGHALRYEGVPGQWTRRGTLGIDPVHGINEINDLAVHNGKLYAGVIPLAEVYRYEQDEQWSNVSRLVHNDRQNPKDHETWNRVPCLTEFRGRLFAGTSNCTAAAGDCNHPDNGKVFSMSAGRNVSHDHDLGEGWHHLALVRDGQLRKLRLHVDGKVAASCESLGAERFNLDTDASSPWVIGAGPQCSFRGAIRDVRLYHAALGAEDIAAIAAAR